MLFQEIFKELSEAYSILSNEEKKSEYDELYKFDHLNHEDDMSEETNDDFLPSRFEAKTEDPKTETPEPKPSANFFQVLCFNFHISSCFSLDCNKV